jgi:hypothetical protein
MKIVTNLAIPHEVYCFYLKVAENLVGCTTEDVLVDALTRYAAMISNEIMLNHDHSSKSKSTNG